MTNLAKHGIDFEQAQELWDNDIVTFATKPMNDEAQYLNLGIIAGKHWTAITTLRGNRIRIISVRRSRKKGGKYL
ncbi:toxin [Bombiscardovia apis]|uniref:Toxin n=1 Tax=Bombiscardovia apis TaxID=2932182 RepID=A0ABN6SGX9_9BIFI|nr:BrnT family toxin [Bombiscardovia apis]BDR54999.1 toxin [Bombiscardovia apis]